MTVFDFSATSRPDEREVGYANGSKKSDKKKYGPLLPQVGL
jgi:hypothetical protein